MKKLLTALLAVFLSAGAHAALYQFNVLTWACSNGATSCGGLYGPEDLNQLAVSGPGSLFIDTFAYGQPDEQTTHQVSGITFASFDSVGIPIDLSVPVCRSNFAQCTVDATFDLNFATGLLTGSFFTNNTDTSIFMASVGDVWFGYQNSDFGPTREDARPVFSGIWQEVPEPGTLTLAGLGLAVLLRRRQG